MEFGIILKLYSLTLFGEKFPEDDGNMLQIIGLGKILLIVLIVMGQDPFASIGQPTPRIFSWALSNKVSACMMLFLLCNTIES